MKILLHACCAPCAIECINDLKSISEDIEIFWYNPNIHPFMEYKNRKDALTEYCAKFNLNLYIKEEYGLRNFINGIFPDFNNRCGYCYALRLEQAAKFAKENDFNYFSTSLLISPYQNHELIKKIGQQMARKHGVNFVYRDFRPYFRIGQQKARNLNLYMQKYCGCIFSEEERYFSKINKN